MNHLYGDHLSTNPPKDCCQPAEHDRYFSNITKLIMSVPWLLLMVLWCSLGNTVHLHASSRPQDETDSTEVQQLVEQHGLDTHLVIEMLEAGISPQWINANAAAVFESETKMSQQRFIDPDEGLSASSTAAFRDASALGADSVQAVALVLDGSGSISSADFTLQKEGILLALQDSLLVPRDGSIALMVIQFANGITRVEVPFSVIQSDTDADAIGNQIRSMPQIHGSTNPGDGILAAAEQFQIHATVDDETIICLSTDGQTNAGENIEAAQAIALGAGVPLDTLSVLAIEDPGRFTVEQLIEFYTPIATGNGTVTAVETSEEYAAFFGATCLVHEPLILAGLEVVQTIQDWQNSVPLIAEIKTFVRAHFESLGGGEVRVAARLHGTRNGLPIPDSPKEAMNPGSVSIAGPNAAARRNMFEQSLNFELTGEWLRGDVTLRVERVGGELRCQDRADIANDCTVSAEFQSAPVPEVRFVSVAWTGADGVIHKPTDADINELTDRLRAILPVVNVSTGAVVEDLPFTKEDDSTAVFSEEDQKRLFAHLQSSRDTDCQILMEDCRNLFYYGVLVDAIVGGQSTGAEGKIAFGNLPSNAFEQGRNRHAHMIAQMLGLFNAVDSDLGLVTLPSGEEAQQGWCGELAPLGAPNFPYRFPVDTVQFSAIGPTMLGEDALIYGLDTHQMAAVSPTSNFELTSFCGDWRWISDVTYNKILDQLRLNEENGEEGVSTASQQRTRYRIFRGFVDFEDESVTFLPSLVADSDVPIPQPISGEYRLIINDNAGNVLEEIPFTPVRFHTERPEFELNAGFFFIPVADNPAMQDAVVQKAGVEQGTINRTGNEPTVTVLAPNGGENLTDPVVKIEWRGEDLDGDPLTYFVQFSRDNGNTWHTLITDWPQESYEISLSDLGKTSSGLIRVITSDGFNVGIDDSDSGFLIQNNKPSVSIDSALNNALFSGTQLVVLSSTNTDVEDGQLADANLQWRSDIEGVLGFGRTLAISADSLTPGIHQISLTGEDSDGLADSDSLKIRIIRVPPPPPETISVILSADELNANSNDSAQLTTTVLDINGNPVPNYPVSYSATLGTVTDAKVTDASGVTTATVVAPSVTGVSTITVSAGRASTQLSLNFVAEPPRLSVTSTDNDAVSQPGGRIVYTLFYTNSSQSVARDVVILSPVPKQTTFDAANSTSGWVCENGMFAAGAVCTFTVGSLPANSSNRDAIRFAVIVNSPLPIEVKKVHIQVTITGSNAGVMGTAEDSDETPLAFTGLQANDEPMQAHEFKIRAFIPLLVQ